LPPRQQWKRPLPKFSFLIMATPYSLTPRDKILTAAATRKALLFVIAAASVVLSARPAEPASGPASTVTEIVYGISNGGGTPADNRIYRIDLDTGDLSNMVPLT